MKKKALLASVVALVTASAMTFAPVSYKVIDKVSAAPGPVVVDENVVKAAATLEAIYTQIKNDDVLAPAYTAMIEAIKENVAGNIDIAMLPHLSSKVDNEDVNEALEVLLAQLITDYGDLDNVSFDDVSEGLDTAINNLNALLGTSIDRADVAAFLKEVKEGIFEKIEDDEFWIDLLEDGALTEVAKNEIKAILTAQWDREDNTLIDALKGLYDSKENLLEDIDTLITTLQAELSPEAARAIAVGTAALGVGYVQYYFKHNPLLDENYSQSPDRKKILFDIDFDTNLSKVLGFVKWKSNLSLATVEIDDEDRVVLDLSSYSGTQQVTFSAVLDSKVPGIPSELDGAVVFSVPGSYNLGGGTDGGGIFVPTPELGLVSDYQAKAAAISALVADYLEANPDLFNNTLKRALIKQLEEQLRQALTVQAANSVTVSNGVSTLNITPAQMTTIYDTQLNTVLNALKAALEEQKLDLNISPVLTYNIGATSNGEVNLSKDLIDSLTSKEIAYVGVKTGDASVEASLDQLTAASKVSIKKAASTVAGAKSDTYSIAITNTNGDITGFEKQYRVTLPVNGTGSNVTVAKLGDGTQSLIGGQYDSKTRTITFFTNVLGDFVVVENSASFNDTANITWANDKIKLLADKGLLLGKGNGKFDPHGNVTRAEFTAMLVRTLNLNATTNITFNDVSENAWYYDSIAAARAYGIINGRSASEFDPNAQISREEMASIASNALKTVLDFEAPANAEEILNGFVDAANVVAVHRANVALLANEGIVQGKGKNNYDPKGTATRAESAVIIAKLFDLR